MQNKNWHNLYQQIGAFELNWKQFMKKKSLFYMFLLQRNCILSFLKVVGFFTPFICGQLAISWMK